MTTTTATYVDCPACRTRFPIDPDRVPEGGVHAICARCWRVFPVPGPEGGIPETRRAEAFGTGPSSQVPGGSAPPPDPVRSPAKVGSAPPRVGRDPIPAATPDWSSFDEPAGFESPPQPDLPSPEPPGEVAPPAPFGRRDPEERARRLARVLASDIVSYYSDRYTRALRSGTLAAEFEEEIGKSWEEYVAQVGAELAESTPYFREALNQVLAGGKEVF